MPLSGGVIVLMSFLIDPNRAAKPTRAQKRAEGRAHSPRLPARERVVPVAFVIGWPGVIGSGSRATAGLFGFMCGAFGWTANFCLPIHYRTGPTFPPIPLGSPLCERKEERGRALRAASYRLALAGCFRPQTGVE